MSIAIPTKKNIGTHRNSSEPIETHNTSLPKPHNRISWEKAQSNRLLWVTISYYEHSDTDKKNIRTHRNSSEPIGTHNTNLSKHHNPISCQKGSYLALTRKLADGTYYVYFPFASLTEESKMTPYHKKFRFYCILRTFSIPNSLTLLISSSLLSDTTRSLSALWSSVSPLGTKY